MLLPPLPAAALAHPSPTAPPQPSRALRGASPRRLHICHTLSLAPFVARRMQGGWRAAFANQSAGPPRWRRVRFLPRAAELGEPWTTRSSALVGARGPLTEDHRRRGLRRGAQASRAAARAVRAADGPLWLPLGCSRTERACESFCGVVACLVSCSSRVRLSRVVRLLGVMLGMLGRLVFVIMKICVVLEL